jgi:2-amino-4-hydroxy-6-hydroxymethyldihydropteridine diphosphokinase
MDQPSTRSLQHEVFHAKPSTLYGIALGSNLGDRIGHLREAVRRVLKRHESMVLEAAAPIYETEPVDCPVDSYEFYNTVIEIRSELAPLEMLAVLQEIETALGRPRDHGFHAPRTIDLDILYADDLVFHDEKLTLPHPRLEQRRFVLQPLANIRPHLHLPGYDSDIITLLQQLQSTEAPLRIVAEHWIA